MLRNRFRASKRRRRKNIQTSVLEALEARLLLTDLSGEITTDMTFTDPDDVIFIVGDTQVREGATLTFGPDVLVVSTSTTFELHVSDDGSGARLEANGVEFGTEVILYPSARGNILDSEIDDPWSFFGDSTSGVVALGNDFSVAPTVHPEYVPLIVDNDFRSGSTLTISGDQAVATIDTNTTWPAIPNIDDYRILTDVAIEGGASLTIADQSLVESNDPDRFQLFVSNAGGGGSLIANEVTFTTDVVAGSGSVLDLKCTTMWRDLVLLDGSTGNVEMAVFNRVLEVSGASSVDVFDSNFKNGTVEAIEDSGTNFDLSDNWWASRTPSEIELKILHEPDESDRPLVAFEPVRDWFPKFPPGMTVLETDGGTQVSELNGRDTLTVVLETEPIDDVVIDVTTSDDTEVSPEPAVITFNSSNWNQTQTISVVGVDDPLIDGDVQSQITVAIREADSDIAYDNIPPAIFSVITTDNETAGFLVTETGGSTVVSEPDDTDSFNVRLTGSPVSPVVLQVTNSNQSEAVIDIDRMTFTPENWNVPQSVTVTAVEDDVADGVTSATMTVSIVDNESDDLFDPVSDQLITVTIEDDDTGLTVSESDAETIVSESGDTDDVAVVLKGQPLGNVVVLVTSDDRTEVTVSQPALTFTPSNWDEVQTVTVIGVDDDFTDGDQRATLTFQVDPANSHPGYAAVSPQIVRVDNIDNDGPGFEIIETGNSTIVSEDGDQDSFSVSLNVRPLANVYLVVESDDPTEAEVIPATLTFTPSNWTQPRTAGIVGIDDLLADGEQVSNIVVSVRADSDPNYVGLASKSIPVITTDDEFEKGVAFIDEDELAVVATDGDDVIKVDDNGDNVDVEINGRVFQFAADSFDDIRMRLFEGDDSVDAADTEKSIHARLFGGDDMFIGGEGNDTVRGGGGSDTIHGNGGNDVLTSGSDADILEGDGGNDSLSAGDANDRVIGGPGRDTMSGARGRDTLAGGSGADRINGANGHDSVGGGAGNDTIFGGDGRDTLKGGTGSDLITGGSGVDRIVGGADRDLAIGGSAADQLNGNDDDDILVSGTTTLSTDALVSILEEWNSNRSYEQRVANIRGTDEQSATRLNTEYLTGSGESEPQTVFADGGGNVIVGSDGLDVFFATDGDVLEDRLDDEIQVLS